MFQTFVTLAGPDSGPFLDIGESSSLKTKVFVVNYGTPSMSMLPRHTCLQMYTHVFLHTHTYTHKCFHIHHKIPSSLCILLRYQQSAHIYIIFFLLVKDLQCGERRLKDI